MRSKYQRWSAIVCITCLHDMQLKSTISGHSCVMSLSAATVSVTSMKTACSVGRACERLVLKQSHRCVHTLYWWHKVTYIAVGSRYSVHLGWITCNTTMLFSTGHTAYNSVSADRRLRQREFTGISNAVPTSYSECVKLTACSD